jgi:hypothetical protein
MLDALSACAQEKRESLVGVGNQNARLWPDLQASD